MDYCVEYPKIDDSTLLMICKVDHGGTLSSAPNNGGYVVRVSASSTAVNLRRPNAPRRTTVPAISLRFMNSAQGCLCTLIFCPYKADVAFVWSAWRV